MTLGGGRGSSGTRSLTYVAARHRRERAGKGRPLSSDGVPSGQTSLRCVIGAGGPRLSGTRRRRYRQDATADVRGFRAQSRFGRSESRMMSRMIRERRVDGLPLHRVAEAGSTGAERSSRRRSSRRAGRRLKPKGERGPSTLPAVTADARGAMPLRACRTCARAARVPSSRAVGVASRRDPATGGRGLRRACGPRSSATSAFAYLWRKVAALHGPR